jgi:hypothetical protein
MPGDLTYQMLQFTGLGTLSYTVGQAGAWTVQSKSQIPTPTFDNGLVSGLVTTIQKNGSTVGNGTSETGASGHSIQGIVCAVGDVLSVVYSSSASVDELPNTNVIQSQVVMFLGY